jgi:8-oxo-dGTP pyrophosphatase MutT (NUDIX family)
MRIRDAVRAIVLDPDDRTVLVLFDFGRRTVWATPGGGTNPGESDEEALRRELAEEVGLEGPEIGPHVLDPGAPLSGSARRLRRAAGALLRRPNRSLRAQAAPVAGAAP